MQTTVKERLIRFLKHADVSKYQFEIKCGLSKGYVGNMRVSIQPDKVQSIAKQFPQLNTGWLLTGDGEMLRQSADTALQSGTISMPADVWKVISNQAESLKTRDKQIDSMLDTLNVKEKQTADLIALLQSQLKKSQVAGNQSHVASQVVEEEE